VNKNDLKRFVQTVVLALTVTAVLSACATPPNTGEPNFEIQLLSGRSLQIVQGSSTDFQVRLNRDRFTDPITVTASELPAGVTAGAVTTTGSVATLRFLAADDAVQGDTKSVTIFATAGSKTSEAVTTALSVRGAPGALDTTFGGGRVTFAGATGRRSAALTPDNRIILVGSILNDTETSLVRLTADGKRDASFPTRVFKLAARRTFIGGVVVQPDGKIVVALTLEPAQAGQSSVLGVVRFTAQGEFDPSFSGDGIATLEGIRGPSVSAVTLTPDGSIVVAGSMFNGQDRDFLVARFSATGEPNLGTTGFITDSFGTSSDEVSALAITPEGSIVVTGQTQFNNGARRFVLARYLVNGTKDTSFGQAGHVTAEFNDDITSSAGSAITLQPDGKMIATGSVSNSAFAGIGLVRLLPNGQTDASFGNDGTVILDFEPSRTVGTDIALGPNGRIVVAGITFNFNSSDFALARLEPNGKLDLSFGNAGRQTTDFGGTSDRVNTLLRPSDGRLVLVGSSDGDLALARYWP
jgi:uncharacterized delta-60 repeat protein